MEKDWQNERISWKEKWIRFKNKIFLVRPFNHLVYSADFVGHNDLGLFKEEENVAEQIS